MYVHNPPAPKAHALLAACLVVPALVYIPYNVSILLHAMITIYAGAWRSVKTIPPAETMTQRDAAKFPIVGSCVLFGLFVLFKLLPKEMINTVLALYLVALGVMVITGTLEPFVAPLFPAQYRDNILPIPSIPRIPMLTSQPTAIELTPPEAAIAAVSSVACAYYYFTRNWLLNNVLGIAFSIMGIEHMSLGSMGTACILLLGLFVYDIFWVFCTPVMVSVAKNFDAPIKLLFPRAAAAARAAGAGKHFAMLGLGDIVIPGLFVALMLRHDYHHGFTTRYFQSAFWGYTGGLATTIFVMNYFQAAQPALLYIVPGVLGAVMLHAAACGQLAALFKWQEPAGEEGEGKEGEEGEGKEGEGKEGAEAAAGDAAAAGQAEAKKDK